MTCARIFGEETVLSYTSGFQSCTNRELIKWHICKIVEWWRPAKGSSRDRLCRRGSIVHYPKMHSQMLWSFSTLPV